MSRNKLNKEVQNTENYKTLLKEDKEDKQASCARGLEDIIL